MTYQSDDLDFDYYTTPCGGAQLLYTLGFSGWLRLAPFSWASCHLCCFHVLCLINAEQDWVITFPDKVGPLQSFASHVLFCLGFVIFSWRLHGVITVTNGGANLQPWNAAGWKQVVQGGIRFPTLRPRIILWQSHMNKHWLSVFLVVCLY